MLRTADFTNHTYLFWYIKFVFKKMKVTIENSKNKYYKIIIVIQKLNTSVQGNILLFNVSIFANLRYCLFKKTLQETIPTEHGQAETQQIGKKILKKKT